MQVNHSAAFLSRLALAALMAVGVGCTVVPEAPQENPYERDTAPEETVSEPVRMLQNQALAAINESQYRQAMDYLQRAIKIEPRNARSWHYLADVHWRRGEMERCRAMIERSQSYVADDAQLTDDNRRLMGQCQ